MYVRLIFGIATVSLSACGHDFQNGFDADHGTDSGAVWNNCAPITPPAPSPALELSADSPSKKLPWCKKHPHWLGCPKPTSVVVNPLPKEPPATCQSAAIHNTRFCQVDSNGKILSDDHSAADGDPRIHAQGGGCIARPIREVWAVLLNQPAMKPDDVNEYHPVERPDLVNPAEGQVFAFDVRNIVHALGGIVNPEWTVRWYHSINFGTYAAPNQLRFKFQKVDGTSHINYQKGNYVLDRVTENVTSFTMEQWVEADRYDVEKGAQEVSTALRKLRNNSPDWTKLPAISPVALP